MSHTMGMQPESSDIPANRAPNESKQKSIVLHEGLPEFRIKFVNPYSVGVALLIIFFVIVGLWISYRRSRKASERAEEIEFQRASEERPPEFRPLSKVVEAPEFVLPSRKVDPAVTKNAPSTEQLQRARDRANEVFSGVSQIRDLEAMKKARVSQNEIENEQEGNHALFDVLAEVEVSKVQEEFAADGHFSKMSINGELIFDSSDFDEESQRQ